jgi:hypothetical protein
MKRVLFGGIATVVALGAAYAAEDPMRGFYGNTLACYWTDAFQCRVWYNADGTENYFEARWLPEGFITMKAVDGQYKVGRAANGGWCILDARQTSALKPDPKDPTGQTLIAPTNVDTTPRTNCGYSATWDGDAMPGDHWFELHTGGQYQDNREQFTILPGHQ